MIALKLEDFQQQPLRDVAVQLAIPNAANLSKDDLVRELKKKLSPDGPLVFTPLQPGTNTRNTLGIASLIVALLAAFFTCGTMIAQWTNLANTMNKYATEQKEKEILEWSTTEVYSILEKESRKKPRGVDLDEIQQQYVIAATSSDGIHLEKKQLQQLELRKILLDLLALKVIWQTAEDRYLVARTSILPGGEITYAVNRGVGAVLSELAKGGGKYTIAQLEEVITKKAEISRDEYHIVINAMLGYGMIIQDKDGNLWAAENEPPPEKRRK